MIDPKWPRSTSLATVLVALLAGGPSTAGPGEGAKEKVIVGYVFGRPARINFRLYTHLCHAFLTFDGDGKVRKSGDVPSRGLTAEAHKAGVKVLLSLGGWGFDDQFASIASRPQAEDRYVKSVMEIVDGSDYDGIDLDWEYPDNAAEVVGFERLCRRLRKDLDAIGSKRGRPMTLTMAASSNLETLGWLDRTFLLATMDWINVMTYDYTGDWTDYAGHHSPLFASSKQPGKGRRSTELTMKYLVEERKLPADRLAVGIPLYGLGFGVAEPYASTKGVPKARLPDAAYANLHKLRLDGGWARRWDPETGNPWLIAPDRSAVIGYDDAESAALKAEWARKQGFRGVFFWQVAGDRLPDGSNPLQEAASKALLGEPRPARPPGT